jgi:hypothetical protein
MLDQQVQEKQRLKAIGLQDDQEYYQTMLQQIQLD